MNYQIIGGDGKEYGPISEEGVTNWLQEGRANGDTRIKEVGAEEWQCVRDLPGFASAFSTAISAPPAGPVTPSPAAGQFPQHPVARQFPQQKPGKLQAMAVMTLVGGILATLVGLGWMVYCLLLGIFTLGISCIGLPFAIYELIAGILCIIQGSKLLGNNPDPYYAKTKTTAIMQIVCIICCDGLNLTLGIVNLVFLNDEEVKAYIRSKGGQI
jgi:hypothetical protein